MPRPGWCTTRRSATPRALVSAQEHAATIPRSTSPVRVSSTSWERPLHVMDGALVPYLGVASDTALEQVVRGGRGLCRIASKVPSRSCGTTLPLPQFRGTEQLLRRTLSRRSHLADRGQ